MTMLTFIRLLSAAALAGCAPSTLLDYELDSPAMVLEPVGAPPITDGRAEYRRAFCALLPDDADCDVLLHRLGDEPDSPAAIAEIAGPARPFLVFVVPGLFGDCMPDAVLPFEDAFDRLRSLGHDVRTIPVSGRSSSSYNAAIIRQALQDPELPGHLPIVLVGYSKGVADVLHALVEYPEVSARVDAVLGVAGAVNGSPIADDLPGFLEGLIRAVPEVACTHGDDMAIDSLRRRYRMPWLAEHPLPDNVLYASIPAFVSRENVSKILRPGYDKLAAMDPRNDSQVVWFDQVIPGSHLLGFANADHWAVALPLVEKLPALASTVVDHNAFPRSALLEAALAYIGSRSGSAEYEP